MENWTKDYDELAKMPAMSYKKKPSTPDKPAAQSDVNDLNKRLEKLEKMVYNLKMIIDHQVLNVRKLRNTLNQEQSDGYNYRQKTVSK